MAKDKKAKKKAKVPKTIAGMKVPKEVRKAAKPVLRAMDNPVVMEAATAAFAAAVGAIAQRKSKARAEATAQAREKVAAAAAPLRESFSAVVGEIANKALGVLHDIERKVAEAEVAPKAPDAPEAPEPPRPPRAPKAPRPVAVEDDDQAA